MPSRNQLLISWAEQEEYRSEQYLSIGRKLPFFYWWLFNRKVKNLSIQQSLNNVYCDTSICNITNSSNLPSKGSQSERDHSEDKSSYQNFTEDGGPAYLASLYAHKHPLGTDDYEIIC